MDDILILTVEEMTILAKAAQMKQLFGIQQENDVDESQLMLTIHDMVERKILRKEENGFSVLEPYKTILKNIKFAKRIISIEDVATDMQNTTFFYGEKIISMQVSVHDRHALRLGVIETRELFQELRETGFIPDSLIADDLIEVQTEDDFLEYYFNPKKEKRLLGIFRLFDIDEEGEIYSEKSYEVVRHPYNYWIIERILKQQRKKVEGIEDRYHRYNPKKFFQMLTE